MKRNNNKRIKRREKKQKHGKKIFEYKHSDTYFYPNESVMALV